MSNGPPPADFDQEDFLAGFGRRPELFPPLLAPRHQKPRAVAPLSLAANPEIDDLPELIGRVLERWGLWDKLEPTAATLSIVHAAYLTHVPFENATKLIRLSETGSADRARRTPTRFWNDHLKHGTGGTCFAASSAFKALLEHLGYKCSTVFCRLPREKNRAHVAMIAETDRGPELVDVGYALPAPVPLPKGFATRCRTAYYDVEIRRGPNGEYLVLSTDDRGTRFRFSFSTETVSADSLVSAWNATFDPRATYMKRLALGRFTSDSRYIYKSPDRLYLISRARERSVRFDPPGLSFLSAVFRIPVEILIAADQTLEASRRQAGGS